jgi:hypothetical protein
MRFTLAAIAVIGLGNVLFSVSQEHMEYPGWPFQESSSPS